MAQSLNKIIRDGSNEHTKILAALRARINLGERRQAEKDADHRAADDRFMAYVPTSESDKLRKDARKDDGTPAFTTVQIPYSYATMLSAHTYWTSTFLSRSPVLQYTARHGEPQNAVQSVEALMDYQVQVGRQLAPFYIWMHDSPKYGYGILWNYWDREYITVSEIVEENETYLGMPIPGKTKKVRKIKQGIGYEGNRVFNVRPYDFLYDSRVSLFNIQKGEFVGREVPTPWSDIVNGQHSGRYMNVDFLEKRLKAKKSASTSIYKGSTHSDLPEQYSESLATYDISDIGFVDLVELVVRIIPRDWHLGTGNAPELWSFTIADLTTIIEARPYGCYHAKFPVFILPYEIDGYSASSRGMIEILTPLEDTMNWLFNTHFYNVRAALNNQFIYDPSRIVTKDIQNPQAGKLIRLREAAYGTDVRTALHQLPVGDMTSGHLRDVNVVAEMIQRVSGVTDNIMGMVNAGGRKTATEVRTSSGFGINRLKTTAEWWSAGDFGLLAQVMLQNTQQYYDMDRKFKIVGDLLSTKQLPYMEVTPDTIQGFYDFVPVDGTMPVDRYAQANLWKEVLFGLQKMPQIGMQYDMGGIFEWMSQLAGMKNIKQFRLQVRPDDVIQNQFQQGNIVPAGGRNGGIERPGGVSGEAYGGGAAGVNPPEPSAPVVSGIGPTG